MAPVTEMGPVLVRKDLMDSVVVLRTVKEVVMTELLYVHHVWGYIMEISAMRHVQIIVHMAALVMESSVHPVH